jgi:hypothetical protein
MNQFEFNEAVVKYLSELARRMRYSLSDTAEAANGYGSSFTPVVAGSTVAGTGTYDTQVGTFYTIGLLCFVQIQLEWDDANHTGTGDVTITGLPYTSAFQTDAKFLLTAYDAEVGALFAGVAQVEPNTTTINKVRDSAGTAAAMNADHTLTISGCYRIKPS